MADTTSPKKSRRRAADDLSQPNVYRVTYKAIAEILADKNPAEAHHRQWLQQRLAVMTRQISAIEAQMRAGAIPIPTQGKTER